MTARVSVSAAGVQGNRSSSAPSISADGRFVAFYSDATNLVTNDTNNRRDIFVHDRFSGETSRVSVSSSGAQGDSDSYTSSISADGNSVVFASTATNLVAGDTNASWDVFVHDRRTGETSRVSVDSAGRQGNRDSVTFSISAEGRYVAFESAASNLVPSDVNGWRDVFVHDRQTGETSIVSVAPGGEPGDGASVDPSISADGRFVAFTSAASNLVPGDTNGVSDVFVRDRATPEISRVSVDSAGTEGNLRSSGSVISADASFVSFESDASNLVSGDTNGARDVFVHSRSTGTTARTSVDSAGLEGDSYSSQSSISADGRFVTFTSDSTNLVPADTNGVLDAFLHDRITGETSRVSVDSNGVQGNSYSFGNASVSDDGRFVAFPSGAINLVSPDANGTDADVYVRDRLVCDAGNVNGGAGAVTDVLFVNDSAGGPERTVRLQAFEPLAIFMATPPSAAAVAPFALYAWSGDPVRGAPTFALPFSIGETCLPTPLTGGSPAPRFVWNNTRSALAGVPTRPSSAAPSFVVRLPRGLGRPASAYLQGIIRDPGAPNGRAAVTNAVSIEIR